MNPKTWKTNLALQTTLCWAVVSILSPAWQSSIAVAVAVAVTTTPRLLHYPLGNIRHKRNRLKRRGLETNEIQIFDENIDHDELYRGFDTHYVNLYVGCPNPQLQTVIIDTGSGSTGFPCSTCEGGCGEGHQLNPPYQEAQSTCYRELRCDECVCDLGSSNCVVSKDYMEGSSWAGIESTDVATIGGLGEEPFDLRFACQNKLTGLFHTQLADGIAGLAKSSDSLWSQLYTQQLIDQPQFSLCLQNTINNPKGDAGVLVFGGTDVRFHRTPMVFAKNVNPSSFFWEVRILNLLVVEAGGGRPEILSAAKNARVALSDVDEAGMRPIVDSGTTYSYFEQSLEAPIREAWEQVTAVNFGSSSYPPAEVEQLPTIWFEIEGVDNDVLWIAFSPSDYLYRGNWMLYFDGYGETVLGANFMSGHDVLFDDGNRRIGFAESDCVLLDDMAASGIDQNAANENVVESDTFDTDTNNIVASGTFPLAVSSGSSILLLLLSCLLQT